MEGSEGILSDINNVKYLLRQGFPREMINTVVESCNDYDEATGTNFDASKYK